MIIRMTALTAASALVAGPSLSAAVLTVDTGVSGRYQSTLSTGDYSFGNPLTGAGRVVGGAVPRVGTNGGGTVEFLGVYGFVVTSDFANDINGGGTASLAIGVGAGSTVTPASIDILLLQTTDASSAASGASIETDVIEATPAGVVGTLTAPSTGDQFVFDISSALSSALGSGTLTVGDYIWIGADTDITGVGNPTNIEIGTGPVDVLPTSGLDATITSTPIPEPGTLLLAGLGGLAMISRRRRA